MRYAPPASDVLVLGFCSRSALVLISARFDNGPFAIVCSLQCTAVAPNSLDAVGLFVMQASCEANLSRPSHFVFTATERSKPAAAASPIPLSVPSHVASGGGSLNSSPALPAGVLPPGDTDATFADPCARTQIVSGAFWMSLAVAFAHCIVWLSRFETAGLITW